LWSGTKENFADVPSFTVLKTQICVTRPQCVKITVVIVHTTTLLFLPHSFLMCRLRILCVLYNPKTKGNC